MNMSQNLHLMYDEKIIDRTIYYFEQALPNLNKYIILLKSDTEQPKYVKSNLSQVHYVKYGSKKFWKIVGDSSQYRNVIIHYLGDEIVDFILKVPETSNVVWIVWGGDLYDNLLEPCGFKLFAYPSDITNNDSVVISFLKKIKQAYCRRRLIKAIYKIPYICLGNDFSLLLKYFPQYAHLKRRRFFYYPVDDMIDESLRNKDAIGDGVFVGNSAAWTNNHRKVFEILAKCDIGKRKVYVPLSYGPAKDFIMKKGKELLKDNFSPITNFMPLQDYNKLMLNANIFIYGNYRPQAFGNIVVALYIGAMVFLDPHNPMFKSLSEAGFVLYSVDDLPTLINNHLSIEEKKNNRNLINELYSLNRMNKLIIDSFWENKSY